MNNEIQKLKFFLYARKSSESEDRQVQSIDDQIRYLKDVAEKNSIQIIEVLNESKSAKLPENRPVFQNMIERIKKGEGDGILCWHLNRLSRNPIDSGTLSWLLQKNIIKAIRTYDRAYLPDDNVLLLAIESAQANQDIRNLSTGVKRGMEGKITRGWFPHIPPLGYLNDRLEKTIIKDPERFDDVQKMWRLFISGYSVEAILEEVKKWNFKTRKFTKYGYKPISRSALYRMFRNSFYAGWFSFKGQEYKGKHEPMITLDEFNYVQDKLSLKSFPKKSPLTFKYRGLFTCKECGALITAEKKVKFIKSEGILRTYILYHCTGRKKYIKCNNKACISEAEIEKQIKEEISKYSIIPEFRNWGLEVLKEKHSEEISERQGLYDSIHKMITDKQAELDELLNLRIKRIIDDEKFSSKTSEVEEQILELKKKLRHTEERAVDWTSTLKTLIEKITNLHEIFENSDIENKLSILNNLGSNWTIKDGKVAFIANKFLEPVKMNIKYLKVNI